MTEQHLELNLLPSGDIKFTPAFKSQEEYEGFCRKFREAVALQVERFRIERTNSEKAAGYHWVD